MWGPRGSGRSAGHKPRRVQVQKDEAGTEGSRARGGHGASRVEPDTQQRQVSRLRLSANPRASATPALGIPSSCSPEPTSLSPPRPEPNSDGGCACTQPFPAFWFSWVLRACPHPLSPPPPSRNSEKLEGPVGSPPLPRAGSSWMEQLGRRDLGVWNTVI